MALRPITSTGRFLKRTPPFSFSMSSRQQSLVPFWDADYDRTPPHPASVSQAQRSPQASAPVRAFLLDPEQKFILYKATIVQVEWTWRRKGESHQCNKSTKMNPSDGKEAGPALRQVPQPATRFLANDRPEDIVLAQITSHASPLSAPPTEQRRSGIPRHAIYHSTFWTSQGHHPAPRPCGRSPAAYGACRKCALEVLSPCVNSNHNH